MIPPRKTASVTWQENGVSASYALAIDNTETQNFLAAFERQLNIFGQYAELVKVDSAIYEAIRDPLGIEKLFYVETSDGSLHFSRNFFSLFQYQSNIYAVPRGLHVRIGPGGMRELVRTISPDRSLTHDLVFSGLPTKDALLVSEQLRLFQEKVTHRIEVAFSLIAELENEGWQICVALSGGLDSSGVACAARRYCKNPVAFTVDLGRAEDAQKASLIAETVGIDHLVFKTNEDELLGAIAQASPMCQDFRDFNVHCAVLNIILAKNIKCWAHKDGTRHDKLILLTGDLMNEFTVDYAEENIEGKAYYRLPRIGPKKLQTHLIGGIDTSDREASVFKSYGISCIQPYAILYDLYAELDETVLGFDDIKKALNAFLVPAKVLSLIPQSKIRAQIGSKETMGVLGLCHSKGIAEDYFLARLLENTGGTKNQIPIIMGRYDIEEFK